MKLTQSILLVVIMCVMLSGVCFAKQGAATMDRLSMHHQLNNLQRQYDNEQMKIQSLMRQLEAGECTDNSPANSTQISRQQIIQQRHDIDLRINQLRNQIEDAKRQLQSAVN